MCCGKSNLQRYKKNMNAMRKIEKITFQILTFKFQLKCLVVSIKNCNFVKVLVIL